MNMDRERERNWLGRIEILKVTFANSAALRWLAPKLKGVRAIFNVPSNTCHACEFKRVGHAGVWESCKGSMRANCSRNKSSRAAVGRQRPPRLLLGIPLKGERY